MSKTCILPQAAPFKELAALYPSTDEHRQYVHWVISNNNGNSVTRTRSDEPSRLYDKIFEILNKDIFTSTSEAESLSKLIMADYIANTYGILSDSAITEAEESIRNMSDLELTKLANSKINSFTASHVQVKTIGEDTSTNNAEKVKNATEELKTQLYTAISNVWSNIGWLYDYEEGLRMLEKEYNGDDRKIKGTKGFTVDGKLWTRDMEITSSATKSGTQAVLFHEYAHVWFDSLYVYNKALYDKISDILRKTFASTYNAILNSDTYGQDPKVLALEADEREIVVLSELFATVVGERSYTYINKMIADAQKTGGEEAKNSIINDIKKALKTILESLVSFIKDVVKDTFGINSSIYKNFKASEKVLSILNDLDSNDNDALNRAINGLAALTMDDALNLVNPYKITEELDGVKSNKIAYSRVSPEIEQAIAADQKKFRDDFGYTQQDEIINKLTEISNKYEQSEKDSKGSTKPTVYYKSVTRGLKEQYSPTTISTDDVKIDEDDSTISTDAGNIVHEYVGMKLANPMMSESEVSSKVNAKFFGDKNAGIVGTAKNVTMNITPDSNTTTGSNGNGLHDTFLRIQQQIFNDIVDINDGDTSALDDVKFLTEVTIPMMSEDGKRKIMGRIDLLAVDKKGNVYVYDFKTSGNNFEFYESPYYDRDKKSKKRYTTQEIYQSQILAYCTMLNKAYGIRPVKSAIIKINVGFEKRKSIHSTSLSTEGDERVNIARVSLNQSVSENNVTTGFDYLDSSNPKVSEIVYKMLGDIVAVGNLFGQVRTSEMAKLNEFSKTKPANYEVLKLLSKMQAAITLQYDRMSHNYKFVDKARDINKLSAEYATLTREEEQLRKLILYYNNFIIGDLYHKLKEFHDAGVQVDWSSEFRTEHQDEVLDLLQEVRYLRDSINIDEYNTIFDAAMSILSKDLEKKGKYSENIDNLIEIKKTLPLINDLNRELGSKFLANILYDKTEVFKHNLTVENRDLYDRYAQYERTTNPEQKRLLLASSDISLDVSPDSATYQKFLSIYNDDSLPTVDEKRKAFIDYMINQTLKSGKTLKDYELSQMEQELLHTAYSINKTTALFDSLLNTSDPICSALVSMWSKQYQEYRRSLAAKEQELVEAVEAYEKEANINHVTMTEKEAWARFLEHDDKGNTTGFLLNNSLSSLIEAEDELFRKLGSIGDSAKRAKMIKSFYIENYEIISEDGDVSSVIESACDDLWAKVVAFDGKLENNSEFETAIKDNYKKILSEYTNKDVLSTRILPWASIINSVYSETNESDKIDELYDIIISHEQEWRSENLIPKGKWHNKEWDEFITETIGSEYVGKHPAKQLEALEKSKNAAARLYMIFRNMAKETDDKLPGRFSIGLQLPGVRKESGERIRDSKGNIIKYVAKQVGEDLAPKEADALRGTVHTDAQGREYYSVPIHYTQKLDEEDQSYSLPNIYKKYWAMGQHYRLMSEISSVMEVGAAFVRDRDVYKTNPDGSIAETKNKIGRTPALSSVNYQADQLDAFMKTYFYKKLTDAAIFNIGNMSFDFQKIVTKLNSWTGATMLSLNKNQGIANIITGEASLFISMTKGSKIEFKDWMRAHKIFMKNIPGMMEDIGKRRPTSKATLLFERFNVLNGETLGEENLNKRTRVSSLISRDTLNFMNNLGELSMRGKAFFAMISKIKPKDKDGNIITSMNGKKVDSILDLYEVVDGKLTLVTDDTYDAVKTGWTQKDQDKFMMDFAGVMFYVHGAYGDMDKIAFERNAFFQNFYLFRKYIAPNIIKHWGEKKYINRMDMETEGYMRTPIVFVMNCIKDLKRAKVVLATDALTMDQRFKVIKNRAGALKPYEIANMRKFVKRMSLLAAAVIGAALLGKGDGDDDDEKYQKILKTNAQYQVKRFISELTFYTNPLSAWDILKSPMASLSMIETVIRVFSQLLRPLEKYETGVHAGEYKIVRQTMKLIPVLKQDWIFSADPISDLRQQLQFYDKANVYTR